MQMLPVNQVCQASLVTTRLVFCVPAGHRTLAGCTHDWFYRHFCLGDSADWFWFVLSVFFCIVLFSGYGDAFFILLVRSILAPSFDLCSFLFPSFFHSLSVCVLTCDVRFLLFAALCGAGSLPHLFPPVFTILLLHQPRWLSCLELPPLLHPSLS